MSSQSSNAGYSGAEIAIVGMAGRFPGADSVEALWRNLRDGVESVVTFTDEELRERGVPQSMIEDPAYVKAGIPFDGADRFDAGFFGYSPREAEQLDPQQRVFLECAWHALEHAGYDAQRLSCPVGVYAGAGANLYLMRHLLPRYELDAGVAELTGLLYGNAPDALSTRVAYKLNLRGPAVTVQTACSTSLAAVHIASQALLSSECDMALAGGVWLNLLQSQGYLHQPGAILSSDGHCRAFDAAADGTVLGSGAGVVVLKRLEDALRDRDTIHAIIKGSAANNDGSAKVGYTAPSIEGQAQVIRAALAMADVSADTIGYVEAHGTGTTLGDPIEIAALAQAFSIDTTRRSYCAIGSLKTNIGHLDAAAGVAGLIKTTLALRHRTLPASLHFDKPNPKIDFANSPFYVNATTRPWDSAGEPRRAGISGFGIGGTNVHIVLEEAPTVAQLQDAGDLSGWHVLPVSAASESALQQAVQHLANRLQEQPAQALADVAYTLQQGRRAFPFRAAVVANDHAGAMQALAQPGLVRGKPVPDAAPEVVFLFPGAGSQHASMGAALYDAHPVFRKEVDHCLDFLRREFDLNLREVMFPAASDADRANQSLSRLDFGQPALFIVSYATARLWMSLGVKPTAMLGHSLGEYVAACLAGVFSLEDALRVVTERARLQQKMGQGAMTSVLLSEAELQPFLRGGCELAVINGEQMCVLAGQVDRIDEVEQTLAAQGHVPRRLHIAIAAHSSMTEPVMVALEEVVASVPRQAARIPFISNVTGQFITSEQAASPSYWANHLRSTVRFLDGLNVLLAVPGRVVLEVGPSDALTNLAKQHARGALAVGIWATQAHARQHAQNAQQFAQVVGSMWSAGSAVDWSAYASGQPGNRVPLPTYPFQHRSFWLPAIGRTSTSEPAKEERRPLAKWFHSPIWRRVESLVHRNGGAMGCTVVLTGASPIGDGVIAWLRRHGAGTVVRVSLGATFVRLAADSYQVRSAQKDDLVRALNAIVKEAGPVMRVCHLWSLDEDTTLRALDTGFMSLMSLAQALGEVGQLGDQCSVFLTVASSHVEDVTGGEKVCPEKATLLGLCRVIPQELPHVACRMIDVSHGAYDAGALAQVAEQIGTETLAGHDDAVVAYRSSYRWIKHYEAVARPLGVNQRLRKGGVYLITGGLGGVGLTFARHLAEQWQARLILLTHTPLPPREQWDATLTQGIGDDAVCTRLRHIRELESLGAEVLVVEADVGNGEQVHQAVLSARERFGAIHGVIHAAGRAGGGLIALRSRADVEKVFAPKIQGTRNIFAAVSNEPLDFVLLCSTLTAIVGGFGQGDYGAANSGMDAFAVDAQGRSRWPVISVNWDVWRNLGMAVGQRLPDDIGIEAAQGGELLERILAGPATPQVIVSTVDLERQFAYVQSAELAERLQFEPAPMGVSQPRPALDVDYVAPTDETERKLAAIWSDLLGVAPIGIQDNLFDLGGHSLLAVQILSRVRSTFGLSPSPSEFFRDLTINGLAALVRGKGDKRGIENGADLDLLPAPRSGVLRPAPTQRRIWVFDRLADGNAVARSAYNEALALSLDGELDVSLLKEAVRQIVLRHEILRTTYPEDEHGDPITVITADAEDSIAMLDLSGVPDETARLHYQVTYDAVTGEPFDLAKGPLLRGTLVRFTDDRHVLILTIHHIIFDGWSIAVFASELWDGYQALRAGRAPQLVPLPIQYADYALWHERKLAAQSGVVTKFWSDYLAEGPLQSTIPYDHPRPKSMRHHGKTIQFGLDSTFSEKVRATARTCNVTTFTLLFAAFLLVLHRRLGKPDVLVGTDVAGRGHADLERLIGFFVNVVPVRSRLGDGNVTFRQWLSQVQDSISAVLDHQDLPLDQIMSSAKVPRGLGANPLVQILFVLQNTPQRRFELDGLTVGVLPQTIKSSKFDMAVFVQEKNAEFVVDWVYATELYADDTATALTQAWREALQILCSDVDTSIAAVCIPVLSGGSTVHSQVIKAGKFDKLAVLGKKPSTQPREGNIRISFPSPERQFPVMIEAIDQDLDPVWWAGQQRDFIEEKLRTHAGIVFRNFGLQTPQDFERFTEAMEPNLYGEYGDLPKKEGGVNTYRSTPYPEKQMIMYHNESSHTDRWPRKQWFFCELPARVGGITPIVDCRELLSKLPVELVEEMAAKGLLYVRNFHPKLDVSWRHFFKTESRSEVEERLARGHIEWAWLDGDILQTRTRGPAVITHPLTGKRAFFNQVQLHHARCLEPELRDDLLEMVGRERMPRNVYFGDGSPIPDSMMDVIGKAYEACAVRFDWQRGDVVMLDNMLAAHARDPYEEPRKIVVAMGAMYVRDADGSMRALNP